MRDHDLDSELNEALAKYAAAEPRAGLEQRVLANLRAERVREARRGWRVAGAALATAIAIAAIFMGWRAMHSSAREANVALPTQQVVRSNEVQAGTDRGKTANAQSGKPVAQLEKHELQREKSENAVPTKLDQFPTPEPLTEQERLLLQFVQGDPGGAALVAQAQTEALQREAEELKAFDANADSGQEER